MFVGPKSPTMQSVQLSAFLMLGVFIIIATSSSDLQKSTEKENNCPTCGAAGANGLPDQDARDGSKGEKRDLGLQGPQGLEGLPGKEGQAGLKGDKRSAGTKGQKRSSDGLQQLNDQLTAFQENFNTFKNGLQQSVQRMNEQLTTLQDNFIKYLKALIFSVGKEVGSKLFVTDGLEYNYEKARRVCSRAGGLVAAPRTADENHALQEMVLKYNKQAFLGITDIQIEGTFQYSTGEEITYSNWNVNEPNNVNGNEECVALRSDGKWYDIICTNKMLLICEF
uniref:Mannose-binding protein-like n=1 Tax=Geotrypetes seraphini TaxID=260995 RepID=A0A6P8RDX7_GEOSA|nr:mannose-binding protein-like [Geotrypetes seraphini]